MSDFSEVALQVFADKREVDVVRKKYRTSKASVVAMLRPEVLATTARLEPS